MENPKKYVKDYIEGRVQSKEFLNVLCSDSSIFEWLQSIVPNEKIGYYDVIPREDGGWFQQIESYDVRKTIYKLMNQLGESLLGKEYNIHCEIVQLFKEAFPKEKIAVDCTLKEKSNFLLDACPEYIDGLEVEESGILERLLNELPEGLSKTQRIKLFREKLKAEFHVEGQKYPRWIQGGEWPYSNGKPMRFLGQKSKAKGEYYEYYFEDIESKEQRTIIQFM